MAPLIIWGGGRSSLLQPTLSWQTFLLPKNTFQSASFILCAHWPCVMNKADCVCMLLRFYLLVQVFRTKSNLFDVLHAYSVEKRLMLSSDQVTDQRQFELEEGICTYFVQTSKPFDSNVTGVDPVVLILLVA